MDFGINLEGIKSFILGVIGIVLLLTMLWLVLGSRKGNVSQAGNALAVNVIAFIIGGLGLTMAFVGFGSNAAGGLFGGN